VPMGDAPPRSNVTSIVDALERRAWERTRADALSRRKRSLETFVAASDFWRNLMERDLDADIAELYAAGEDVAAAQLRCGRAARSCMKGDVEGGLAELAQVMAEQPDMHFPYVVRARWRMQQDPAGALPDFDRAVALSPNEADLYWRRGDCYRALDDQHRALANYRRGLALDPTSIDGMHALAQVLLDRAEYDEALGLWNRLIAMAPPYADFFEGRAMTLDRSGAHEAALADYDRSLDLAPDSPDIRFCRAMCASECGHLEEATGVVKLLTEQHPDRELFWRCLGSLYTDGGQPALALPVLTRACEMDPDDANAYAYRGRAHMALGDAANARTDFERALALDPTNPSRSMELLGALKPLLDKDAFLAEIDRLATQHPADWALADLQGTMLAARGEHERAIAAFDRVIAGEDGMASTYRARALSHAHLGHVQEAFDDCSRAIELEPDAWAHTARGVYRTHLEHDEALVMADFDRALELDPDDGAARYQRGSYLATLDEHARAVEDFDRAIAIAPTVGKVYFERATSRARITYEDDDEARNGADYRAAIADLRKALELGYEDGEVYGELSLIHQMLEEWEAAEAACDEGVKALPGEPYAFYLRHELRKRRGDEQGAAADRARAVELGFEIGDGD